MIYCDTDFNETQWGWDTCSRPANHTGDHYDSISKQYGHNYDDPAKKVEKPKHKRPLWMK